MIFFPFNNNVTIRHPRPKFRKRHVFIFDSHSNAKSLHWYEKLMANFAWHKKHWQLHFSVCWLKHYPTILTKLSLRRNQLRELMHHGNLSLEQDPMANITLFGPAINKSLFSLQKSKFYMMFYWAVETIQMHYIGQFRTNEHHKLLAYGTESKDSEPMISIVDDVSGMVLMLLTASESRWILLCLLS